MAALLVWQGSLPATAARGAWAEPQAAVTSSQSKDLAGNWQGTLTTPQGTFRIVVQITRTDKEWTGKLYSIDQGAQSISTQVKMDGMAVDFVAPMAGMTYHGTLSADGKAITGKWTQGPSTLPLDLARATKESAWELPAPPAPPKMMPADADPSFDVATIKPNNSGATSMQGLVLNGRNFRTQNSSLGDLICFAYEVQMKQIVGAPDWLNGDRYDIAAVPDVEGAPSAAQLRLMIRKLLKERFALTFHKDQRELSAYVLTVGKTGSKLKETEIKGPLPGIGLRPAPGGLTIPVANATMRDFSSFLQSLVLDRPVVDKTGQTGRYDFTLTFAPDDTQFNGHPPVPPKAEGVEAAPSLFDAIQQQLGLRLDAQKTQVEVIAIDHVQKPSAN